MKIYIATKIIYNKLIPYVLQFTYTTYALNQAAVSLLTAKLC